MIGKLFRKDREGDWEVTIKCGDMVRRHRQTGEIEYRDCNQRQWIPISEMSEIHNLKDNHWATREMPGNEDD